MNLFIDFIEKQQIHNFFLSVENLAPKFLYILSQAVVTTTCP